MTSRPSAGDDPTLRVRGPAELIALVPFLLGFHPDASLVLVGLRRERVRVTVRVDLADLAGSGAPALLAHTLQAMAEGGAVHLIAVVYDHSAGEAAGERAATEPLPWHELADLLADQADHVGLALSEQLLVSGGRWWAYGCEGAGCCPPEGMPLPDDPAVPAAAAFAGLCALPDRAAYVALLAPEPDESLLARLDAAVRALTDDGERAVKRALFAAARAADRPGVGASLNSDELVRLGAGLALIPVRDAVWLAVDDGRLDGRELWRLLGRRLPGPYAAAPMFLFGWASWRAGNGALAGIAADCALAADPEYVAADLLDAALTKGVDPRQVPKLRRSA